MAGDVLHRASEFIRAKDPSILAQFGAWRSGKELVCRDGKGDEALVRAKAVVEFVTESKRRTFVIAVTALAENGCGLK